MTTNFKNTPHFLSSLACVLNLSVLLKVSLGRFAFFILVFNHERFITALQKSPLSVGGLWLLSNF